MRHGSRLLALLFLLVIYAILSTSLFTKLLLIEPVESSSAFLHDEVLVVDESDDVTSAATTDDAIDNDPTDDDTTQDDDESTQQEQSNNPFTCLTEGAPAYLPAHHVIRRSLHGVIIGTQKGGTQALHTILLTHPKILTSGTGHGELHFFNRYYQKLVSKHSHTIPRQQTRDAFLKTLKERNNAKRMAKRNGKHDITSNQNSNSVGFHSAPLYLFSGRKVPSRMLCTAPWIKVIALLRNPIERAFSMYHFIFPERKRSEDTPTFEQYVLEDIALLKQFGVLRHDIDGKNTTTAKNNNVTTSFANSPAEYAAWEKYIAVAKGNGPIGRGLYAIQLGIWMEEFQRYNKSLNDLLILQSEVTKAYPQEAYHQSVQLFGLEARTTNKRKHHKILRKNHHATDYSGSDGMSEKMYRMLYELYEPYNRRLGELLGEEWVGVWDDRNDDEEEEVVEEDGEGEEGGEVEEEVEVEQ